MSEEFEFRLVDAAGKPVDWIKQEVKYQYMSGRFSPSFKAGVPIDFAPAVTQMALVKARLNVGDSAAACVRVFNAADGRPVTQFRGEGKDRLTCPAKSYAGIGAADTPTDNPVATFYAGDEGYPAWTASIRWSNVVDMKSYAKGKNDFERFEAARDEVARQGGGVLYYPAGIYDFKDAPSDGPHGRGLMLRSGVVIRGEAPSGNPLARHGRLELTTKFVFAYRNRAGGEVPRDWSLIGLCPEPGQRVRDVNNVGICWVDLSGAAVFFGFDSNWGPAWRSAEGWQSKLAKPGWAGRKADGTHPKDPFAGGPHEDNGGKYLGAGHGRLVFGCVLRDACVPNDCLDQGFGPSGFFVERFVGRLSVYGSRVMVANNLLPKPTKVFKYQQKTLARRQEKEAKVRTVMFDYGMTMGIDINKDLLGQVRQKGTVPGYFEEGVLVRDNYVWNHGNKGFNISGGWAVVQDNHNERTFLASGDDVYGVGGGWTLTMDGYMVSNATDDNLARAFDMAGRNLWIDRNSYNNTGSTPGNDGEGILCQLHGGTHVHSWAVTHNDGSGKPGYIGAWNVDCLGLLIAWNKTPTAPWTGAVVFSKDHLADCAFVANSLRGCPDRAKPPRDLANRTDLNWPLLDNPPGAVKAPRDVKAQLYEGDGVKITWTDAANNEIGFRVDRQIGDLPIGGGKWTTIAYRPPRIQGHANNPQAWVDFFAPPGKQVRYRVAAVNADDGDQGASPPTPSVRTAPARTTTADVDGK
jgi:hypothetical protein